MGYCLKIIKKDGDVVKHYFSSYDELDYNATLCQFSANIIKAIGMKIGLFKNKILFEIGQFGIVFAITLNRKSSKTIKIMNRKKILEVVKGLDESRVYLGLYDVLTDGSTISENWLDELEEKKPTNEKELIDALIDLNIV